MSDKSLVKNLVIDTAERAHLCRSNKKHSITKGQKRLSIKEGRSTFRYCTDCAKKFLTKDTLKLQGLLSEIN